MTWVKLCGMTRAEDVRAARDYGADAVGFIFAASPRQISVATAAAIGKNIHIPKVGVFVNSALSKVREIAERCSLDYVQLHGNESPEFCRAIGLPVIKSIRVQNRESLNLIQEYTGVWKILLDAYLPGAYGGTGKRIENRLLVNLNLDNVILAGGIGPGNVKKFLSQFSPFGVDISSGIEESPGIKNHIKIQQLLQNIKENN